MFFYIFFEPSKQHANSLLWYCRCVIISVLCASGYQLHKLEHLFSGIPSGGVMFLLQFTSPQTSMETHKLLLWKYISNNHVESCYIADFSMLSFSKKTWSGFMFIFASASTRHCGLPCNRIVRGGCFAARQRCHCPSTPAHGPWFVTCMSVIEESARLAELAEE